MDTDYIELTIKDGNNEFVVGTSQIRDVDGLKNYIVGEIGTARSKKSYGYEKGNS